jgi:hypothetical protein
VSASKNLDDGLTAGVAGLSYQAVEAAATLLIEMVNGHDPGHHSKRILRATQLLHLAKVELDSLWDARNIDFYGNVSVGMPRRQITPKEARDSLGAALRIVAQVKSLLDDVGPC